VAFADRNERDSWDADKERWNEHLPGDSKLWDKLSAPARGELVENQESDVCSRYFFKTYLGPLPVATKEAVIAALTEAARAHSIPEEALPSFLRDVWAEEEAPERVLEEQGFGAGTSGRLKEVTSDKTGIHTPFDSLGRVLVSPSELAKAYAELIQIIPPSFIPKLQDSGFSLYELSKMAVRWKQEAPGAVVDWIIKTNPGCSEAEGSQAFERLNDSLAARTLRGGFFACWKPFYESPYGGLAAERVFSVLSAPELFFESADVRSSTFSALHSALHAYRESIGGITEEMLAELGAATSKFFSVCTRKEPALSRDEITRLLRLYVKETGPALASPISQGLLNHAILQSLVRLDSTCGSAELASGQDLLSRLQRLRDEAERLSQMAQIPVSVAGVIILDFRRLARDSPRFQDLRRDKDLAELKSILKPLSEPVSRFAATGVTRANEGPENDTEGRLLSGARRLLISNLDLGPSERDGVLYPSIAAKLSEEADEFLLHLKWRAPQIKDEMTPSQKEWFGSWPLSVISKELVFRTGLLSAIHATPLCHSWDAFQRVVLAADAAAKGAAPRELQFIECLSELLTKHSARRGVISTGREALTPSENKTQGLLKRIEFFRDFTQQFGVGPYYELAVRYETLRLSPQGLVWHDKAHEPEYLEELTDVRTFFEKLKELRLRTWRSIRGQPGNSRDLASRFPLVAKLYELPHALYQDSSSSYRSALPDYSEVSSARERDGKDTLSPYHPVWSPILTETTPTFPVRRFQVKAAANTKEATKDESDLVNAISEDVRSAESLSPGDSFWVRDYLLETLTSSIEGLTYAQTKSGGKVNFEEQCRTLAARRELASRILSPEDALPLFAPLHGFKVSEGVLRRLLFSGQNDSARASFYLGAAEGGRAFTERVSTLYDILSNAQEHWEKRLKNIPEKDSIQPLIERAFKLSRLEAIYRRLSSGESQGGSRDISFYLCRGFERGYAGYLADTCATGARGLPSSLATLCFADEEAALRDPLLQGCSMVFHAEDEFGRPAVILRGFNPTSRAASSLDAADLFEKAVQYLESLRERLSFESILVPDEDKAGRSLSNRLPVVNHVVATYGKGPRLALKTPEATLIPHRYRGRNSPLPMRPPEPLAYNGHEITTPCLVIRTYT
jgi:hypothetical protein